MREITFEKGNEQHLKDCKEALCRSTLGEKYFSSPGSAETVILEGICQGNLYVALIDEECVGFTYIIPKGALYDISLRSSRISFPQHRKRLFIDSRRE